MPNATRVYVGNTDSAGNPISASAVSLSNNNGFCIQGSCDAAATANCSRL